MNKITAPWTAKQVYLLNAHQYNGRVHPYTCGHRDEPTHFDEGILVATRDGWHCPAEGCTWKQGWAHDPDQKVTP